MKRILLLLMCVSVSFVASAQDVIKSYVINIENNKAYLDITKSKAKVGDVLSIREEAGYMVHPVTKKKIKKEGSILADLEIVEVYGDYSVATIYPEEAIKKIKVGMVAEMPELPAMPEEEWVEEEGSDEVADVYVPVTADGIVDRYLEVSGLKKFMNTNYAPPFWKKERRTFVTKKGKSVPFNSYTASNISSKKIYVRLHSPEKDNFWLTYSKAFAINGDEGWFRFKKGTTIKLKKKILSKIWEEGEADVFGLSLFNTFKWSREYIGDRMFEGKDCSAIRYTLREKSGTQMMVYYDKATGLEAYSELTDSEGSVQLKYLEHRQVGDFILCSKSIKIYSQGKIREETTILEDICFDCPLDNSLFTKEAVKNAFKND